MTRKYLVEFTYQTGEVEEVETFDGTTTTTTTIPEENTGSTTTTSSTTSTTTTTSSTTTTTVPETWEQSTDIVIPEDELDIQGNEVKNNIDIIPKGKISSTLRRLRKLVAKEKLVVKEKLYVKND